MNTARRPLCRPPAGTALVCAALALATGLAAASPAAQEPMQRMSATLAMLPTRAEPAPVPAPRRYGRLAAAQTSLDGGANAAAVTAASAGTRPAAATTTEPVRNSGGRFDLTVNNAPAAHVFNQIGAGTGYSILVAPEVSGTISVSLKNSTVMEALESLRELYGYDFKVAGNRVFVYPNGLQTRMFRINYLPGRRLGSSDVRVSSSLLSGSGGSASSGNGSNGSSGNNASSSGSSGNSSGSGSESGGGNGGDTAHVQTRSDSDFWAGVELSLNTLIGRQNGQTVVLNPAAGVLVVRAMPAELRQVESFLKAVQVNIVRQVMLEAKIVEVSLTRGSETGVNWSAFFNKGGNRTTLGVAAPGTTLGSTGVIGNDSVSSAPGTDVVTEALGQGFYGLAFQSSNFAALLNFLQTQGDVQVLSSPRIATLNNQRAVLKVGSDQLYVTGVTTNQTSNGSTTTNTPTLTLRQFFSGIALDVTPQIDDRGNVILHVHPSVSVVQEKQKNIDLGSLGAFRLPLAASTVNESDSIVRVPNGQIVAIGGLMLQESAADRSSIPGLGDAPVVGGLFGQKSRTHTKRELVILIKPTVIGEDGSGWDSSAPTVGEAAVEGGAPAAR